MSLLLHGDCLEKLQEVENNSVDLIFCDLPYGQTSCPWDKLIDIDKLWKEIMRVKKINTPIFFTTTTKFGVSLITSAPKKCPFRYDLIWCKSSSCGFLLAKKMPMRKHEMIYVFYEKLPFYDLSSHTHKFIDEDVGTIDGNKVYESKKVLTREPAGKYDPPLPNSLIKEKKTRNTIKKDENYGKGYLDKKVNYRKFDPTLGGKGAPSHIYDPPLPNSLIKEEVYTPSFEQKNNADHKYRKSGRKGNESAYDPPLPNSLIKEDVKSNNIYHNRKVTHYNERKGSESMYDPPLPDSLLEIKSTKGKHSTEKPVELMKWILKYYSKAGDIVLDPTMGSGSMGVGCLELKRNFIGIEMDDEIFDIAYARLNEV